MTGDTAATTGTGDAELDRAWIEAPEIAPYLAGGDREALLMPGCQSCGHLQWPPRPFCSRCGEKEFEAKPVDPAGELYSWTTTHRAPAPEFAAEVPYTVVVVALDDPEHTRVLGRLDPAGRADRASELTVGLRMRGVRAPSGHGRSLLIWRIDD